MKNKTVLKFLCVIAFLGLASARKFTGQLNATSLRKPNFKTNSEVIQAYWDPDFCSYWEDNDVFINPEDCSGYLICWNGELLEMWCEPGMLFNPVDLFCDPKDEVQCLDGSWPPPGQDDDLCPPAGSNEVRFLPSNNCNEFYICMNGNPVLLECRPGQHWNIYEEFCDDPEFAGCDPNAPGPGPDRLPDCPLGVIGQIPHPHNCNWFIHCNNGNRSIQQCQHLHHFDVDSGRCVFMTGARCIKHMRN